MRQRLVSLLVVVLLFSGTLCQSVPSNDFVPYRGCLTNPARNYFRPGTVVGEYFDEESGRKVYIFQPDEEPTEVSTSSEWTSSNDRAGSLICGPRPEMP